VEGVTDLCFVAGWSSNQKEKVMKKILEALGVETLPPESLVKLTNDHLVLERAQKLMFEFYIPTAIMLMHPMEKAALLKRISPPPKPVHLISWSVQAGTYSPVVSIHGSCGRCNADTNYYGRPADAQHITWAHCTLGPSKIPEGVIEEYNRRYVPNLVSEGKARF
jgi:hypothetical protein